MIAKVRDWLGFSSHDRPCARPYPWRRGPHHRHHGPRHLGDQVVVLDPCGYGCPAACRGVRVAQRGATRGHIHNIADAGTAIPLWIAFVLARRKPTQTFTYGYGRVEDFAGLAIVLIILLSALVAGYEAIARLIHPRSVMQLGWLAAAGVIGFLGNEAVAVFRIRIGRQINGAALIADGYHARTDATAVLGSASV
jgi:Co/Zn/Cd efflux system component